MNKSLTITALALAMAMTACGGHHHNESTETAETDHHDHDDELIELPHEQAERFGVEVDTVRSGDFATVIHASGIIERSAADATTATAPTAGIVRLNRGISAGSQVARNAQLASIDPAAVSGGDN
ncbi:MAG: hypothetical protein K2L33_06340, partial [Muribaculaceae bacterium]|nr:hypothetical protein [Muribaculaceae bacterium]